jgi:hypothetical protein
MARARKSRKTFHFDVSLREKAWKAVVRLVKVGWRADASSVNPFISGDSADYEYLDRLKFCLGKSSSDRVNCSIH